MLSTARAAAESRVAQSLGRQVAVAWSHVVRFLPAVACIAIALGLSVLLRRQVDPTALFLAAVAVGTWSAGWQAGLLAALLATVTLDFFFTPPLHSIAVTPAELPRLGAFVLCALAVNWASDARRVAVERALRESERQLRALFDEAAVGIALVNATGRAFKTNRRLQDMFGYSESEFRRFPFTKLTHPPDVEPNWNLFAELVTGRREAYHLEKQCLAKNGSPVWAHLTLSLVRDDRGQPMFAIAVVADITDRKRAEADVRRTEALMAEGQRLTHTGSWRWTVPAGEVLLSAEALRIAGLDPERPEQPLAAIIQRIHPDDLPAAERSLDAAAQQRSVCDVVLRIVMPDGSVKRLHVIGRATANTLGRREYVGAVSDITSCESL